MKTISIFSFVIAAALIFLLIPGCNKDNGVVQPANELAPIGNLRALSEDGSVLLIWDQSPFQSSTDFSIYRIIVTGASHRSGQDSTQLTSYTVPGLTNGTVDTFIVYTVRKDGALSQGVTIIWGPTVRFLHKRIWELDAPGPSGLEFSTGDTLHFTSTGSHNEQQRIDIWIDGHLGVDPLLKSPSATTLSNGWRTTKFASTAGSGLNQYYPIPDTSTFTTTGVPITNTNVYFALTQDGNMVRFVITNGIQGIAPNRYIDIDFAYNSGVHLPWAKR
ncbi:MAG: hypothetical protein ACHQQQ_10175 [Bacteroidota bacterium]